jgi:hypothetical protein
MAMAKALNNDSTVAKTAVPTLISALLASLTG